MDKTVRLWHISRRECLCCFQHIDFVTAIAFHPRDDRYFLSGSLDGKLRLWNIPDKKVALWNEVDGTTRLITAANFCQNGKYAVIGTYDGRCIFYDTERLKYHTQIHVRSTRGRNKVGRKITGIEPLPGENKILVTSNDSRIRLYDLRDLSLSMKYKGYVNSSSQIKASFR
ncbi:WD repeat-containing protein 44-like [Notothenia coriiceps]|uniref:WD repeat-containing protein 44 n=1 Tax=Notothenia coriiceps TaxID=8208 RepID=A0A6I9N6M8_9TELE|nr:PREDICTED: WD repeat-containing protein 44-like [Notothenia coriiceps]